jgi:chemotaxis protein MotB
MKLFKTVLVLTAISLTMASCVSTKKFNALNTNYQKLQIDDRDCNSKLTGCETDKNKLSDQNARLLAQIEDLKKQLTDAKANEGQVLTTLQDMSILSGKQAESVQQSLKTLGEKEGLINNLQSALQRKDSLNMALVMNLKGAIGDLNDKDITIKAEKSAIYIDISDKMLFNSGKYTVTAQAKEVLGKVARVLNAHPDIEFLVEGHTDNVSIHTDCLDDNWDLSVKRATSVIRILQNQYGIQPARMTAAGRGEYIPLTTNNTADGRATNRRTRIVILPQLDQFFKLLVKQ